MDSAVYLGGIVTTHTLGNRRRRRHRRRLCTIYIDHAHDIAVLTSAMTSPKSPSSTIAPDLSILGDRLTLHPPGVTSNSPPALPHPPQTSPDQPLLEPYARFRSTPFDFLREVSLHVSGTGWRSYDTIVGQDVFYKGYSDRMKGMVLRNPQLLGKMEELAQKRVSVEIEEGLLAAADQEMQEKRRREIESQLKEVAEDWTDKMICKMESKRFIRGAYYLATQLLTRAYHQGETLQLRSYHPSPLRYEERGLTSTRHPYLQRRSTAVTCCSRRSGQEAAIHHFPTMSSFSRRLRFATTHLLPLRPNSANRRGRR